MSNYLEYLKVNPSPCSFHERVRHNGNDIKKVKDISEEEARKRFKNFTPSDKRSYVGATYNTEKRTLYIHSHLEETLFQHDKNTEEKGNSVFPKCTFMFRKLS
tara:strand:+ start:90 stop:398 length:309 start_codon:yes stop_codon:yes gene_type:complete